MFPYMELVMLTGPKVITLGKRRVRRLAIVPPFASDMKLAVSV
jgi:hypothetical protein